MAGDNVLIDVRPKAVWIMLNRPDAMNAINPDVIAGINAGLDAAAANPEIRAVVIGGTGRAFCAGADLKYVRRSSSGDDDGVVRFLDQVSTLLNRIESFPLPTIAAVNGLALAGGLEIVLCCDLVIAAEGAKLGDAHANFGLLPGGGGSVRLPRKIGPTRAKYLMYTGAFLPAAELREAGLINEVVPDDQLTGAVERLVDQLAAKSPAGLKLMKQLVDDGLQQPRETALRLELMASALHATSHDMKEGLAAFEEKRPPRFIGR